MLTSARHGGSAWPTLRRDNRADYAFAAHDAMRAPPSALAALSGLGGPLAFLYLSLYDTLPRPAMYHMCRNDRNISGTFRGKATVTIDPPHKPRKIIAYLSEARESLF